MKFNKKALKNVIYPFLGVFLTILTMPAQGMFRAALNQSRAVKSPTAPLYKRFSQSRSIAPIFSKQEKKYEQNRQKPKFEHSGESNSKNSWFSWAAISAGLAAWGLYSTAEAEEQKQDEIEKELKEIIALMNGNEFRLYAKINEFLLKNPDQKYVDALIVAIASHVYAHVFITNLPYNIAKSSYATISESIIRNFSKILQLNNPNMLRVLIQYWHWPENETLLHIFKKINEYTRENIIDLLRKENAAELMITLLVYQNNEARADWANLIQNNLDKILKSDEGIELIKRLLMSNIYERYQEQLISLLIQQPNLPAKLTYLLLKITQCNPVLEKIILNESIDPHSCVERYVKLLTLIQLCNKGHEKIEWEKLSPTQKNLAHQREKAIDPDSVVFYYLNKTELKNTAQAIIEKEKELENNGFYTLIHGQKKHLYFAERLYTFLWELTNKTPIENYLFPWIDKPITDPIKIAIESQKRKILLKQLVPSSGSSSNPMDTLFLNYALWENLHASGENSAYYALNNLNHRHDKPDIKVIFELFGYKNTYEQYKNEIESLATEYEKASKHGNILLVAIPKDKINDVAYYSYAFGRHVDPQGKCNEQLDSLVQEKKDPSTTMFCMPMTFDQSLNPESGIKIFPFIIGDQAKIQKLKEKERILLEKIRKDMRRK